MDPSSSLAWRTTVIENAANLQGVVVAMKQPSELMQSKEAAGYAVQAAGEEHIYTYY